MPAETETKTTMTDEIDAPPDTGPASGRTKSALGFLAHYGTIGGLGIMILIFSFLSPLAFPTVSNFTNVLNQASLAMIIAGGLTMAVIVGELDLSVGFVASMAGVLVTGLIIQTGLPIIVAIVVVIAVGALIGIVNGLIVTKARVNSVIATLGIGTIVVGLNFAYSSGVPIVAGVPEAFKEISLGRFHGVPHNVIIMAIVMSLLWVLVERTAIGQAIQAVGGNPAAARLSGINVDRIKIFGLA